MEPPTHKIARFKELVEKCGTPEAYTAWVDPKRDQRFQVAWRENRVLTIQQNPAGQTKDFGIVGFHKDGNVSYLLFPKPLTEFEGRKIVGIAYDAIHTPPRGPVVKPSASKKKVTPPRPNPGTKSFNVRICVTAQFEYTEMVNATSSAAAKKEALKAAESRELDLSSAEITRTVVGIESR